MGSDTLAEKLRFKTKGTLPRIIKLRQTSKTINRKMSSGDVRTEQSEACTFSQRKQCHVEAIILRLGCLLRDPHTNEVVKEYIKYE